MPSTVFLSTREGKNDGGTYDNAEFNDRKGGGEYPATSITWPDSHLLETPIPKYAIVPTLHKTSRCLSMAMTPMEKMAHALKQHRSTKISMMTRTTTKLML